MLPIPVVSIEFEANPKIHVSHVHVTNFLGQKILLLFRKDFHQMRIQTSAKSCCFVIALASVPKNTNAWKIYWFSINPISRSDCRTVLLQWARKIKKVQAKKPSWNQINQFFSWNCIFGSFTSSKIDFWPFLKLQKMEFGQENYSWFIWFHEFFFAWTFFKFSGPQCIVKFPIILG